jgi:hypothetical protein
MVRRLRERRFLARKRHMLDHVPVDIISVLFSFLPSFMLMVAYRLAMGFVVGWLLFVQGGVVGLPVASAWQPGGEGTLVRVTPSVVRRYEPGKWGTLGVDSVNRTDQDTTELVAVYLEQQTQMQFARRFWLPARSQRRTWLPIRVLNELDPERRQLSVTFLRLEERDGGEFFQRTTEGTLEVDQQPVTLDQERIKTALILRRGEPDERGDTNDIDADAYDTIFRAREAVLSSRAMMDLNVDLLPPYDHLFDSIDQIALCGDRLASDSAGLAHLRHWLAGGGRLWIMLDRTSMEMVREIVGNGQVCEGLDRWQLSEFAIEDLSNARGAFVSDRWKSDLPVEMVRVETGDLEVSCRVEGWPAAFWQKVGDGEILFTTLGPRGWLKQDGKPTEALKGLASRFYLPKAERAFPVATITSLLNEQVGYQVPSRWLASCLLGCNTLGLFIVGGWLAYRRQLSALAWFVPTLTLLTTAAFLVLGFQNSNTVPPTLAVRQIGQVLPGTNTLQLHSWAAVYDATADKLNATVLPESTAYLAEMAEAGETKRSVWTDDGQNRWANIRLAPGRVHYVPISRSVSLQQPIRAVGTWGPDGLTGELVGGSFPESSDWVIAAPAVPLAAARPSADQTRFTVSRSDVMAPDQFIATALMNDEQRRRETLLRSVLEGSLAKQSLVERPSLLIWSQPFESGFALPETYQRAGWGLTKIPLELLPTPPKTRFSIPATFIRIENDAGRQGASSVFDPRSGRWLKNMTQPTNSELRFFVPPQVVPCQLNYAKLTIKVNVPSRELTVVTRQQGETITLFRQRDAIGVIPIEIENPELIDMDEQGGLFMGISVSGTEQQQASLTASETSTWEIDYVRFEVEGETQER